MYGLNAFALAAFGAILAVAGRLRRKRASARVAKLVALGLLLYNLARYALVPLLCGRLAVPVEFSTVSYFAVPLAILTRTRGARIWAAYAGLMAGFFYYATMIFAGGPIYDAYAHADIYISMLCHGALLLCGILTAAARTFHPGEAWKLIFGCLLVAANAQLFRPLMWGTERLFIYEIMDGLPGVPPLAHFMVLGCALILTMAFFFRLNRALCALRRAPIAAYTNGRYDCVQSSERFFRPARSRSEAALR